MKNNNTYLPYLPEEFMVYSVRKVFLDERIDRIAKSQEIDKPTAFLNYIYSVLFNRDIDDIDYEDIIEGSQEKQIDIIHISEENESSVTIDIIQCKYENGFSSNALVNLKNGINWVLKSPEESYSKIKNYSLVAKIKEIRDILQKYYQSNIIINLYFITAGDKNSISEEFNQELKDLKKWEMDFREFNVHIWGADELVGYINKIESKDKIINQKIRIIYDVNRPSLIKTSIAGYKGVICSVKAKEIARIIKEDESGHIFNKNIRRYLGDKKKVNQNIYRSCSSNESELFWFLNNGVTMVCDDLDSAEIPDDPHIKTKNLQIVNGCQTSITLYNAMKNNVLRDDSTVLVRIYATEKEDAEFVDKITLSTNNQNQIGVRDLKANDPIQIDLQKVFLERYKYHYERKVNEFIGMKIDSSKKISNEKIAQAFLAFGRKLPSAARAHPNYIWSNEEYYDIIFNKSTPAQLLFCFKLYNYCNSIKRNKMEEYKVDENLFSTAAYGIFHILRVMGFLLLKSETFPNDDKLEEIIIQLDSDKSVLQSYYVTSVKILNKILEKNMDKYTTAANFYKSNDIHQIINKTLNNISFE